MKHTGGTMRRTDDGFDPLEVAGDGQKCEGLKMQEILVLSSYPQFSMCLNDMLTGGAGFPSIAQIHFDHCVFKQY